MRDWSSGLCSSDLTVPALPSTRGANVREARRRGTAPLRTGPAPSRCGAEFRAEPPFVAITRLCGCLAGGPEAANPAAMPQQPVRLAPSILHDDFARLGEEIDAIDARTEERRGGEKGGRKWRRR